MENLKIVQLKTLCPDHVHRILEDLLPYLESAYGSNYVKTLMKSTELTNLVPKTELISTVSLNVYFGLKIIVFAWARLQCFMQGIQL